MPIRCSSARLLGLFLLVSGAAVVRAQTAPPLANAVVVVIRHAEKPEAGDGLTAAGVARANAYPSYFRDLKIDGKAFHVDHIFASTDSKGSHRPRLTVEPLGKSLNLPVDVRFKNKSYEDLANDLRTHSYGKGIVICWHHGNIPSLLASLGAPASLVPGGKWPSATFDWAIELRFDGDGKVLPLQSKTLHEHLMPGDAR